MNLTRHFDITAVVQALQEAQDSRLLANPNVTVLDHEQALMSIITEIPYQELTETQQGGNIGTTNFRDAGIKLEVTPHVAADGTIRMEVNPSFSRLTGYTPGQNPSPVIDRREAKTVVRVTDRQVLVIGGLRQRNDTGKFNGLPYLKDIKTFNLGALFRGRDTEVRESELVVFIMPEIIPTTHVGSCREGVALQYGQCLLDQVPMATGGHPPYRLVPCCPPVPIGGPRVPGTPYQPNTCPPPGVVPGSVIGPPLVPGVRFFLCPMKGRFTIRAAVSQKCGCLTLRPDGRMWFACRPSSRPSQRIPRAQHLHRICRRSGRNHIGDHRGWSHHQESPAFMRQPGNSRLRPVMSYH